MPGRVPAVTFTLLPAVDVADGQAVRLVQGEAGTETAYGDPLRGRAAPGSATGAEWIHLVDLDAAFGRGDNRELLADGRRRARRRRSSCPAASATTRRWPRRWPPAAAGSTSAPPRWSTRTGAPRRSPSTATGSRSASTSRGTHARRPRLDPRRRRPLRGAGPARRDGCARYVVTDVSKDGTLHGPEPRPAARRLRRDRPRRSSPPAASPSSPTCARSPALVADRASRARSSARRSTRAGSPCPRTAAARRGTTAGRRLTMSVAVRVIPCLDVDAGRVVKGVNFRDLRDAGDPVELAARLRRRGRRRADLPRHHRVVARAGTTMLRRRAPHRRAGVHPADRRRRRPHASTTSTGCCAPARTRSASTPPRSRRPELLAEIADRFGSQVLVLSVDARRVPTAAPTRRASRSPRTAAAAAPASTRSSGRRAAPELGAGEILLNSMDADGTQDGFDLELIARGARGGRRPGDRQRRRGRGRALRAGGRGRAPTPCSPPASSTSATSGSATSRPACGRRRWRSR